MDLMEYKAKEIFDKFDINVQKGIVIDSIDEITDNLYFPVVIKAQVQTGGRGKAGGIKFADNFDELKKKAKNILGMDIKGHIVKKLLIGEKIEIDKELYLSIILDRQEKKPTIIFCSAGGVDIEETAKISPDKIVKVAVNPLIGINDEIVHNVISQGCLNEDMFAPLQDILFKLYKMFCQYDCLLAEINPLAVSECSLVAVDGKVTIDDNALSRHPDILEYRDLLVEDVQVTEARKFNFLYIPCEIDGNIAVMSNGSGMLMSCMDLISKENMKVGAAFDLGGGATSQRIAEAVRIILSNEKIDTLLISIFGGITRCDEVAGGLKLAMEKQDLNKLVVVRIEGTNKDLGLEILKNTRGNIVPVNSITEGVIELCNRRSV